MIDDLAARFIVNLPASELHTFDRILYHLQDASWFYNDHLRHQYNKRLLSTRSFCQMMFRRSLVLRPYLPRFDRLYTDFQRYVNTIHVYGCMLWSTDRTRLLLVRGPTGYWSFPKGKVNQQESGLGCARREVREETGIDVGPFLTSTTPSITRRIYGRLLTMFTLTIPDIPIPYTSLDTTEITDIRWIQPCQMTNRRQYPTVLPFLPFTNTNQRLQLMSKNKPIPIRGPENTKC